MQGEILQQGFVPLQKISTQQGGKFAEKPPRAGFRAGLIIGGATMNINPKPMSSYTPPQIPTLAEVKNDSAFLKQLPRRWKKSAAVLACVGVVGTWAVAAAPLASGSAEPQPADDSPISRRGEFSRCSLCGRNKQWGITREVDNSGTAPRVTERRVAAKREAGDCVNSKQRDTLDFLEASGIVFRSHHGGSGFATYIVHFTEQEALNIIRSRLESAGLIFAADVPDYAATAIATMLCWCGGHEHWLELGSDICQWCGGGLTQDRTIEIALFDEGKNVAIAQTGWSSLQFRFDPEMFAAEFERQSAESGSDITFGVFPTGEVRVGSGAGGLEIDGVQHMTVGADAERNEVLIRLRAQSRPALEAQIDAQVAAFVTLLIDAGILPNLPEPPAPDETPEDSES
jgi:hypothetical protein